MNEQLVYVIGSGRSGSTLLDLIMGNSEFVQSVGEVHRLNLYARRREESCTCGRPIMDCPFWLSVQDEAEKAVGHQCGENLLEKLEMMLIPDAIGRLNGIIQKAILLLGNKTLFDAWLKLLGGAHRIAVENSFFWYEMIRKATECPIILDSTKDVRRFKMLYLASGKAMKSIYVVRDGRGVAASEMRRTGVSMTTAARNWVTANQRVFSVLSSVPRSKFIRVRYEDLCNDPTSELTEIFRFIGIPFSSKMLVLRKGDSHNIGGNPMRFRSDEITIKFDEQWKCQLSSKELNEFDIIAGKMNRKLGYS